MVNRTQIDVFAELTCREGTFDYDTCYKLLGDNYDSFVSLCDGIRLIPEEILTLDVVDLPTNGKAIFTVSLANGDTIRMET